ncbi:MAG: molybdopterin-dependent oxidoreductase [Janthinobacterium lividum]
MSLVPPAGARTTCPYCGVGCGVIATPDHRVVADPAHPANLGRLCSKGAALAETLDDSGRLLHPVVEGARVDWDTALDRVADTFSRTIAEHGPDSVAFYVSGQCLTEDYYVANKLMKGFIGSANIDTNSRLCMSSSVAGHVRAFGADVVPGTYDDLEEADLVILVGSNLAWCHPVLFQRLQAARATRGTKLVVLDPRRTASCEDADLHLQLAVGSDVALFAGLLDHLDRAGAINQAWAGRHTTGLASALEAARGVDVAGITGLEPSAIAAFYALFAGTDRTVTVYSQGVNQSSSGTDKVNAILNVHLATGRIGRPGAGPFSVTGQPNAMGGREVGGLANQLAAHMRFDQQGAVERVGRFWGAPAMAMRPGLKAIDLFEAVADGRVRALWIICTNPADSMPRSELVRAALRACPFVVVSDIWPTDTTALAKVILPAAGWGERNGTVTNSERCITRQRPFRAAPGSARPDWWMLAEVGRRMGWAEAFDWDGAAAVFREHAALTGFENGGTRPLDLGGLADLSDAAYDAMPPQQWPLPADRRASQGGRLFAQGGFPTEDGRARIVPTSWRPPASPRSARFPFWLNTGRVRDQWHTMTRTGLVPRLSQHVPEPRASLHPADASALGLAAGGLVRLTTPHGAMVLRAEIDPGQRVGEVFVPMHWTDAFSSAGPIDKLVGAAVDPLSGQPELKATPLALEPAPVHWRGLLLHTDAVRPPDCTWSRIRLEHGHALDLSGAEALPADPVAYARTLMAAGDAEMMEMADPSRGVWRYAALRGGRLVACLYLTSGPQALPSPQALAALLAVPIADAARRSVLAGGGQVQAGEQAVCACFSVGLQTISTAIIEQRLTSVADIGAALKAGTNCGSCIPELRDILKRQLAPA